LYIKSDRNHIFQLIYFILTANFVLGQIISPFQFFLEYLIFGSPFLKYALPFRFLSYFVQSENSNNKFLAAV